MEIEILGEQIISQSGCYRRVRRWLKGVHPELGKIVQGYTGWETMQEIDVIKAMGTFYINEDVLQVPLESAKNRGVFPALRNVA